MRSEPASQVVPLTDERELRIRRDGASATLSLWSPAPYGQASLGEATLDAPALRRTIAALRGALWDVERAEALPEGVAP